MNNRITDLIEDSPETRERQPQEPHPIGEILEELLAQYERRFPGVRIAVVETPANRHLNSNARQGGSAMLVLTRRENERIVIDGRITVTVVRVQGDRIRIGIEAPQEVPIMREELLAKVAEAVTAA